MGCFKMPEDRSPPECMDNLCSSSSMQCICTWVKTHALLFSTFLGIVLGSLIGALLNPHELQDTTLMLIGFPGELFLRILRMLVLPLIISSIITGTTALNPKINGRVTIFTITYFLLTSLGSAIIGVFLCNMIHPGHPDIKAKFATEEQDHQVKMLDTFLDLFRNALPTNFVEAFFKQLYTTYIWVEKPYQFTDELMKTDKTLVSTMTTDFFDNDFENETTTPTVDDSTSEIMVDEDIVEYVKRRVVRSRDQMNGLGIIVFLMIFGMILSNMREKAVVLVEYFRVLDKIIMRFIRLVIWCTPIGVASLICERIASISNFSHTTETMGLFITTVLVGLFLHQFVLLPLIYFMFLRRNPYSFWWNVIQAFLTGFATESSAAALPVAIQCMEENNKTDSRVTRFVMPVGATINMNGTAMFVTMATLFIAQMNDVVPTTPELITVILTATAASVASSATPSASLYLMVMTLSVLPKMPVSDVGLLFTIDWFLDRCRTTNNIAGDCFAVAVVQHWYGKELDEHRSELEQIRNEHTVPGLGLMFD